MNTLLPGGNKAETNLALTWRGDILNPARAASRATVLARLIVEPLVTVGAIPIKPNGG